MQRVLRFAPEVESQHMRIDRSRWDDVYVVGDVHGCVGELGRLLRKMEVSEDDLVVFVGDLVRKGPKSGEVLELVRGHDNMVSVRGNHEENVLMGMEPADQLSRQHLDYIDSLPVVVSWGRNLVVHGGIDPEAPLRQNSVTDLQSRRTVEGYDHQGRFWFQEYDGEPTVFFGHTVMETPLDTGDALGLDTGCAYGGSLTAYDCADGSFLSVSARRKYYDENRYVVDPDSLVL